MTDMEATSKSLLLRAGAGDEGSWRRFERIYRPLIQGWLVRRGVALHDADDLTQDVLTILVQKLPEFVHGGRVGSFRSWLRTITVNKAREFWRAGRLRASATDGTMFLEIINQLEDAKSQVSRQWDAEHDDHLLRQILEIIDREFAPQTVQAFRRLMYDEAKPDIVAHELGMSLASVYAAKSRILQRLRQEAQGLLH